MKTNVLFSFANKIFSELINLLLYKTILVYLKFFVHNFNVTHKLNSEMPTIFLSYIGNMFTWLKCHLIIAKIKMGERLLKIKVLIIY